MQTGPDSSTKRLTARQFYWLWACAALLPLSILLAALVHEFRAVPMFDDDRAILGFALQLGALGGIQQKLCYVVTAQTGDYKLILEHFLVAADLALAHRVSFGFLIWTGNFIGLGLLWPLWRMFFAEEPSLRRRLLLFLPIVYLVFQMNYVENFDWAMCGLQTFPVVFFSLASLELLTHKDWARSLAACLCASLACFSSSNGFLVAPLGVLFYLQRRAWKRLMLWCLTFAAAAFVYSRGYKALPNTLTNEQTTLSNRVLFFFSFLGSAAESQHRQPVKYGAVILGIGLAMVLCWALVRRFDRRNPAAVSMALWVVLTTIPVLVYRLPAGFQYSLLIRYKIYSDLLLIFCYGFFASTPAFGRSRSRKVMYACALGVTAGNALAADVAGYRFLVLRQQRVAVGLDRYANDGADAARIPVPDDAVGASITRQGRQLLDDAIASGIYTLPPRARR